MPNIGTETAHKEIADLRKKIKELKLEVAGLHRVTESLWEAHEIRGGHRYSLCVAPSVARTAQEQEKVLRIVNRETNRLRKMFCRSES